jgi:hypothetical protein
VGGAVDRVKVHRRLHGRHLRAELGVDLDGLVGDLLDEVGAPVPLVAGRIEPVEGALQRRMGHRVNAVQQGLGGGVQQRRHGLRRLFLTPT